MKLPSLASLFKRFSKASKTRGFEGALGNRWETTPHFGAWGSETLQGALLRSRARHLYANNPHARAGAEAWVSALVGAGIVATPKHPEATTRRAISAALNIWAAECDADWRTDWAGLQADAVRSMVIDGEAFVLLIDSDTGLQLRLLPPEQVDEGLTTELGNGARIVAGVEFDSLGKRAAYHVRRARLTDLFGTSEPPVRIPADQVLHVFKPLGPGQVRGISWLAPVLLKLGEIDQLSDALLVGFKTSAMFAGFLKDTNPGTGEMPFDGTQAGSILTDGLEPGTLKVLPTGWDISFASPAQALQSTEFLASELRAVAAGLGVPQHLISGDLRQANYSSLRADLIAFHSRVEQLQYGVLVPQLLRPVNARALTSLVLSGQLEAPNFEANPRVYWAAEFIPPAQPQVDPAKAAEATAKLIEAGLMSRRQAVAAQGWDIEALDSEIAADRAREVELGLAFSANQTITKPLEPTVNAAG